MTQTGTKLYRKIHGLQTRWATFGDNLIVRKFHLVGENFALIEVWTVQFRQIKFTFHKTYAYLGNLRIVENLCQRFKFISLYIFSWPNYCVLNFTNLRYNFKRPCFWLTSWRNEHGGITEMKGHSRLQQLIMVCTSIELACMANIIFIIFFS